MARKKKRNGIVILIVLMLLLIAVLLGLLYHRGTTIRAAREAEQQAAAEEEKKAKAEEEAAAAKETEEAKIASHVYSHRGTEGPEEHSFKAYDAAIEAGSRNIEQDVVISSDGVLYVSHDLNALSMTGYNGMYEYIDSETVDSLTTDAGNKVLRLSEVFDKYGRDINYIVELKPDSEACVKAFEDMVDKYGFSDIITVQSMYPDVLETLEEKYPDMPKLLVCWSQADFNGFYDAPYVDILSVKVSAGLMTQANCDTAHENGKLFSAWTLDTEDEIKTAIDMGVDTYFTNDTPLALKLEKEYGLEQGRRD